MKLGLNILGEVGIYELRALFLYLLREWFSHSPCRHERWISFVGKFLCSNVVNRPYPGHVPAVFTQ